MLLLSSLPSQEALAAFSAFLWVAIACGLILWTGMVVACVVGIFKSLASGDYDYTLGFAVVLLVIVGLTAMCMGLS